MVPEWYQENINARIKWNGTARKWSIRRQKIPPMPHTRGPLTGAGNGGTARSGNQCGCGVTVFPTEDKIIRPGPWWSALWMRTRFRFQWLQAPPGIRVH
jgi:hypothetical protein